MYWLCVLNKIWTDEEGSDNWKETHERLWEHNAGEHPSSFSAGKLEGALLDSADHVPASSLSNGGDF